MLTYKRTDVRRTRVNCSMGILYIYIIPYKLKNLEKVCYRVIGKLMILGGKK